MMKIYLFDEEIISSQWSAKANDRQLYTTKTNKNTLQQHCQSDLGNHQLPWRHVGRTCTGLPEVDIHLTKYGIINYLTVVLVFKCPLVSKKIGLIYK